MAPMIGMKMSPTMRIDDPAEGGADDDADGEIDDIAAHGEFLEFLEHGRLLSVVARSGPMDRLRLSFGQP